MEFTQPLTDDQIHSVMQGVHDAGGVGYVAVDVPTAAVHSALEADNASHLLFSDERDNPTTRDIMSLIAQGNAAAGKPIQASRLADLIKTIVGIGAGTQVNAEHGWFDSYDIPAWFKSWGDPNNTQERNPNGTFGPGSGSSPEAGAPQSGGSHSFDLKGGLTDKMLTTSQAKLEKQGFTFAQGKGLDGQPIPAGTHVSAEIQQNIGSHSTGMTPAQIQDARDAYQNYHDIAVATMPNVSPEIACSMVAVCSQNNAMGPTGAGSSPTIDMAVNIYNALEADPGVMITQEMADALAPTGAVTVDANGNANVTIGYAFPAMDENGNTTDQPMQPGLYQLSELSPDAAARIIGAGLGTPAAQAVAMYRGADPNDVIDSPKLRNFASNIVDPSNPNSITCDRWVARVELAPQMTPDAAESYRQGSNGAYAILAENLEYFASHNNLGPNGSSLTMIPDEAQAVPWIHDAQPDGRFSKYDSLLGKLMKADRKHKSSFPLTWFDHPGPDELTPEQVAADREAEARLRPMIEAANPHLDFTGKFELPSWFKGFGDPGSTQERNARGEFGPGSGLSLAYYVRGHDTQKANVQVSNLIRTGVPEAGGTAASQYRASLVEAHDPSANYTAEDLKDQVVTELSTRSGLSYDRTNELVATWAGSSSDTQPDSIALQMAVAQQFGVTPTPFIVQAAADQANPDHVQSSTASSYPNVASFADRMADATPFVQAMYSYTQETLASQGISEVTVSRGVGFPDLPNPVSTGPAADAYDLNQTVVDAYRDAAATNIVPSTLDQNPISSWSLNESTAMQFAEYQATGSYAGKTGDAFLLTATIPADRILSTAATGIGCQSEYELTVIGGTGDQFGNVHVTALSAPKSVYDGE